MVPCCAARRGGSPRVPAARRLAAACKQTPCANARVPSLPPPLPTPQEVLDAAEVVCATCSGAGDYELANRWEGGALGGALAAPLPLWGALWRCPGWWWADLGGAPVVAVVG